MLQDVSEAGFAYGRHMARDAWLQGFCLLPLPVLKQLLVIPCCPLHEGRITVCRSVVL